MPEDFIEANVAMTAGSVFTAEFATDGALVAWDVHAHAPPDVIVYADGAAASGSIPFAAITDGFYSVLWHNQNTTALVLDVTVRFEGAAELYSWSP